MDFDAHRGDASYTVGVVSLFLNCIQLSCRSEPKGQGGQVSGRSSSNQEPARCLPPPLIRLLDIMVDLAPTELDGKVRDVDVVQFFQDVFLKTDDVMLQLELLDRLLALFAGHNDNYILVQELRTMPLFIQNMGNFPPILQERVLKVLEYAVTVANCVPALIELIVL
ncbi:unnamed protein product [Sphagnum balticum]